MMLNLHIYFVFSFKKIIKNIICHLEKKTNKLILNSKICKKHFLFVCKLDKTMLDLL